MPPYQGGGDMISSVTFERTLYNVLPYKFEAGTPNIAGAVGLAAALEYVDGLGLDRIAAHEHELLAYGTERLSQVPGLRLTGTATDKAGILAFVLDGVHPHDVGTILDREGVAIRTGHHCCQPLMDRLGVPATARASLALYNTRDEIDALALRHRPGAAGVRMSADAIGTAGPLPGGDPRSQQAPAEFPRDRGRAEGRRPQPAVRRPRHRLSARGERSRRRRQLSGFRLRDLESVGVVDDRERQGQDAAGSGRAVRAIPSDDHAPPDEPVDDLGKLSVLAGVRQFPVRVKCASLPWHTLRSAASAHDDLVSTE